MSTWFKICEDRGPLRGRSAFFLFSNEERPKLRLEFPNMRFGDIARRISANFKALPPTQRAKYDEMAQLDKERYVREYAEWMNEVNRRISSLLHPSARNKDHNYQAGKPGTFNRSETQTDVEDDVSPALSAMELNICSEPLIQEKLYHWYVELSQSRLYDAALKHVVYLESRRDHETEIDYNNYMVEPGDEEVLEIRGVSSSTIPATQYDTLPQDIQTQIKRHQNDMAEEQQSWDDDLEQIYTMEEAEEVSRRVPPFSVSVTKHVIDEFRRLEVYQIQDIAPRCHIPDQHLWARGRSNIEVFDARAGKRLFCRLGTYPEY